MKFYFDESGSFTAPPDPVALSASVVVATVISELFESDFQRDYQRFVTSLAQSEVEDGEPKGRLLSNESKFQYCQLLDRYARRGLLLAPAFVDMSLVSLSDKFFSIQTFAEHVRGMVADATRDEDKSDLVQFADRIARLSEVQGWRLHTWAMAFLLAIRSAMSWLCSEGNESCWETVRFDIDAVDARRDSMEQTLFLRLVRTWLSAYSRQIPFEVHDEVHGPENPFVKRYITQDGIDHNRMLDGNVHFSDSRTSLGIQVADIAASIIRRASRSPNNEDGALDVYAHLMDSCPYPPEIGPGFVYVSSDISLAPVLYQKYQHLVAILEKRRGST